MNLLINFSWNPKSIKNMKLKNFLMKRLLTPADNKKKEEIIWWIWYLLKLKNDTEIWNSFLIKMLKTPADNESALLIFSWEM